MAFRDRGKELSYIAQYQKDNYDRITVMSPKGTKEKLKAAATLRNMSVSEFVLSCVTKELEKLKENYFVFSNTKIEKGEYDKEDLAIYMELIKAHFYADGIINCPYIENGNIIDNLTLISKNVVEIC